MINLFLIPVFAVLNAYRGGGFFAEQSRKIVKIHPRFQVTIIMFAILCFVTTPIVSGTVSLCYLISNLNGWGRWYDLGRLPEEEPRDGFMEKYIDKLPNDHFRFLARHFYGLIPAYILLSPIFLLMPFLIVACYEVAWREYENLNAIRPAEYAVGALWGLFIFLLLTFDQYILIQYYMSLFNG
jgi:hypothetical protein